MRSPQYILAARSRLVAWFIVFALVASACTVSYSFTGASIPENIATFTVEEFPNFAPIVNPPLSSQFSEALRERFLKQTRLSQVESGGDFNFSGEISEYNVKPAAIESNETAALNRFTIAVKVRFENRQDSRQDFEKTFSSYQDFDATKDFSSVENSLMAEIVDNLVDQIFNATAANW